MRRCSRFSIPLWQAGCAQLLHLRDDGRPSRPARSRSSSPGGRQSRRRRARSTSTTPVARWRAYPRQSRRSRSARHRISSMSSPGRSTVWASTTTRRGRGYARPRWPAYGPDTMYVNFTGEAGDGQGAGVLSAGDLREARRHQEALRPDERVPAEPEHSADRPGWMTEREGSLGPRSAERGPSGSSVLVRTGFPHLHVPRS